MMLQLLDNIVRKGIVCIDMAREQERSIARLFQVVLRRTKTSSLWAAVLRFHKHITIVAASQSLFGMVRIATMSRGAQMYRQYRG